MKAVNTYIIIEKIKEEQKTQGGLILGDDKAEIRYLKGKIISVGDNTVGLSKDDIIYYDRHAGHGIEWKEKMYHVIRQTDVVLVE
jgi:co-chaperonin GroES (HSP10)